MAKPGTSPNAAQIKAHIDIALHGLELEPHETAAILAFANEELPHLFSPEDSYLVLGSYRDPYKRRLRIVENELNKRLGTYAFALGDIQDIEIDRLPMFRIGFALVAAYVDTIVAVFEQGAGGEITELGKISESPFFGITFVLPRGYVWMTALNLEERTDVFATATRLTQNSALTAEQIDEELRAIVSTAQAAGIDVSLAEVKEYVSGRDDDGRDIASYSWVHLNEFRLFELHGRCFPWSDTEELRTVVSNVP